MKYLSFLFSVFFFFLPPFSSASSTKELPKIAVWDLGALQVNADYAKQLTGILVSEIAKMKKYEAYSQDQVRTLAGWTGEMMKLGCTDIKCLTALGQMDVAKLISGSVGKIGNRFTVTLNLFDTQKARAEDSVSEFCKSEDELIELVQQTVRKLLGTQVETSSLPSIASDKSPLIPTALAIASGSLEIKTRVQGAQVFVDGQNMGEVPISISNLTSGTHEVRVVKKGHEDWKQSVQIQPNEKKVVEVVLKILSLGEEYFFDKIFYFDNCSFARDKFEYWVKFRRGGILEGSPRRGSNYKTPPEQPSSFKPLDGKWLLEKNKINIDYNSLLGIPTRYVLRMEIQLDNAMEGIFKSVTESSKPINYIPFFSATETEKRSCTMKEWNTP